MSDDDAVTGPLYFGAPEVLVWSEEGRFLITGEPGAAEHDRSGLNVGLNVDGGHSDAQMER